ncbi:hypothetical protein, partial [Erwinia amylovora]|uniref:hypothetical protein n=1 Tax=Erwinia amylovora TaxID=552 RepID=UPI0020BEDE55
TPQTHHNRQLGEKPADVREAQQLARFSHAIHALDAYGKLLAYHDPSDGGLHLTLADMAFTGHCGNDADIATLRSDSLPALIKEELRA